MPAPGRSNCEAHVGGCLGSSGTPPSVPSLLRSVGLCIGVVGTGHWSEPAADKGLGAAAFNAVVDKGLGAACEAVQAEAAALGEAIFADRYRSGRWMLAKHTESSEERTAIRTVFFITHELHYKHWDSN